MRPERRRTMDVPDAFELDAAFEAIPLIEVGERARLRVRSEASWPICPMRCTSMSARIRTWCSGAHDRRCEGFQRATPAHLAADHRCAIESLKSRSTYTHCGPP